MSFRDKLNKFIRDRGRVSYGDFANFCVQEGYKISTGERELRESRSPDVGREEKRSKRGTNYIAFYVWIKNKNINVRDYKVSPVTVKRMEHPQFKATDAPRERFVPMPEVDAVTRINALNPWKEEKVATETPML